MREDFGNRFNERFQERRKRWEERMERRGGHSHVWTGIFILFLGVAALIKASVTDLPNWLFSWQMFLIALGFFSGLKHGFRGGSWFIMMLIGGIFLVTEINPELHFHRYMWSLALIVIGAFIILRPRRRNWSHGGWQEKKNDGTQEGSSTVKEETWSQDDFIDSTSIFGGAKKNILSKDFKGGDIVSIFGGTELNLTQADIKGKVEIELTTIFGGTKLIVPPNWAVQSEVVTIFGGLEDKRSLSATTNNPDKILVLKGTVIFGGIDIKSF